MNPRAALEGRTDGAEARLQQLRRELSGRIEQLTGRTEKLVTDVPGLTLVRRVKPTAPYCVTYEPSLALITQGRKEVLLGTRRFVYDDSHYLLTSVDLPIVSHVHEASEKKPFVGMALKLEPTVVRAVLRAVDLPVVGGGGSAPAMATSRTTPEILDACRRLVDLVGRPADIAMLSGMIQREIVYRLLQGPEGGRLHAIATLGNQSQRTAKAIEWIRRNYAKPLRVAELAEMTGMAVSTFHHHFRALTSMSPVQYQKQLRLQEARGRMIIEGLDAASAAFEVGYESASQFNREYRRMFGLPPLQDVRAERASARNG